MDGVPVNLTSHAIVERFLREDLPVNSDHLSIEATVGRPTSHINDINAQTCKDHLSTETSVACVVL